MKILLGESKTAPVKPLLIFEVISRIKKNLT